MGGADPSTAASAFPPATAEAAAAAAAAGLPLLGVDLAGVGAAEAAATASREELLGRARSLSSEVLAGLVSGGL